MLKLKNIKKVYITGDLRQEALKGISLTFNKGEFVSITGPSGCGKTTTLNIIGGLDRYTSGDLEINGVSTKKFTDSDWDAYRNHSVGFVFQSYNLVSHSTVLANVELGMTLSGVSKAERKEKALDVLKKVGLEDHTHKKPNQLSGGQRQRVAIARALVNDPEIILADEPSGALDSKTSMEIMELIKEISEDKLVIMVTHNKELAEKYSTRIVNLKDGEIIGDTNGVLDSVQDREYKPKKTSMSFLTALSLSFNNLKTKFGRTLITAFAGSIGIIGVALVLSLSNGMNSQISSLEEDQLSGLPITVTEANTTLRMGPMSVYQEGEEPEVSEGFVTPYDPSDEVGSHKNSITEDYVSFIEQIETDELGSIQYILGAQMNVLADEDAPMVVNGQVGLNVGELPNDTDLILENYELIEGTYPENANETLLVVDEYNRLNQSYLSLLGYSVDEEINLNDLLGTELVVADNDYYYLYNELAEIYMPNQDLAEAYQNGIVTKITGIVRPRTESVEGGDVNTSLLNEGVYYTHALTELVLENGAASEIAEAQLNSETNILTGQEFSEYLTKEDILKSLGALSEPVGIMIYPNDFDSKELIKEHLDEWNEGLDLEDQVVYSDMAETITDMMGTMLNLVQTVLVAFAAISLVVSAIMIGIITYVSVLERTKEIGILRSLGARKRDIKRVFNAETIIVGFVAGSLGIALTYALSFPINGILSKMLDINNIVQMDIVQSLGLVALSIGLTLLSGLIPASIASKKDPVNALRTE